MDRFAIGNRPAAIVKAIAMWVTGLMGTMILKGCDGKPTAAMLEMLHAYTWNRALELIEKARHTQAGHA